MSETVRICQKLSETVKNRLTNRWTYGWTNRLTNLLISRGLLQGPNIYTWSMTSRLTAIREKCQ